MLALSLAPSFLPKIALLYQPKSKELERSQIIHSVHLLPWWNHVNLDTRPELSVGPVLPTCSLNGLASLLSLCSNPLQYSCLENPRDGGACWAAVYGVAQSWTRLKWLSSSSTLKVQKQTLTCPVCEDRGSNWGLNSPGHLFCGDWCPHLHHLLWRKERHSQLHLAKVPLCASSIGTFLKFFGFLLSHTLRPLDFYRDLNLCYHKGYLPKKERQELTPIFWSFLWSLIFGHKKSFALHGKVTEDWEPWYLFVESARRAWWTIHTQHAFQPYLTNLPLES